MDEVNQVCKKCGGNLYSLDEVEEEGLYCENCDVPPIRKLGIYDMVRIIIKPPPRKKGGRPYRFTMPH
jgi:hypothetical protein